MFRKLREWFSQSALRLYAVSVLIAILPIGLFFHYTDRLVREQAEQQALDANMQMAHLAAIFLEDHFQQSKDFLRSYSTDPLFQQQWQRNDLKAIQADMDQAEELQPDASLVSTYTPDGTMTTISPLDPTVIGVNFAYRDWYKGVVRTRKPYVSEVYRALAGKRQLSVAVSVPVFDSHGNMVGIIAAAYPLTRINQWLAETKAYGNSSVSVVDQRGHLLASPAIDLYSEPVDLTAYEPVRHIAQQESGAGFFRRGGSNVYAAYAPIPAYGWGVIAEQPASLVRGQIAAVRQHTGLLALVFAMLAVLGGAIVAGLTRSHRVMSARLEDLSTSEARYRSLVQGATYGIFRSDERGLLYANPALVQMLGYASEAALFALDMAKEIYFEPKERERLLNLFRGQDRGDGIETTWKRKDGAPVAVRLSFRVLRGLDGSRTFEGIVEDLSMRRTLEEQLRHSEKLAALGRMVAGAAHEINNPLTAILGYAELLAENPSATREQREFAEKIKQQARRTKVITSNLQSFSKQSPEHKRQSVDVNSIVTNAMRIEELNARQRHVKFHQQLAPDLPHVLADEYQILEICMHILNNSVDALREMGGGSITVRTFQEEGSVVIEFTDTGPGIADLSRLFDPFYTTKPIGEGAGLGLSACYGIVKEHGGKIEAHNRAEGGAVVTVRLPIGQSTVTASSAPAT